MADTPPDPEQPAPPPRKFPRRQAIVIAGVGGLAAVGWGVSRAVGNDSGGSDAPTAGSAPPSSDPTETTAKERERRAERSDGQTKEERKAEKRAERERRRNGVESGATEDSGPPTTQHHPDSTQPVEPAAPADPGATKEAVGAPGTVARWSDPATWGGELPGEGDVVVADVPVLLDVDATVAGVRIGSAGSLELDPATSRRLASSGNVVVAGKLTMRPADAAVVHRIEFVGVDEAGFVGGHSDTPMDTDVGLWVVGAGLLDAQGTAKTAWTNLSGEAKEGDSRITVDEAAGWQVGDEIVITPTGLPTVREHWLHHDRRTITSVSGTRVGLDSRLAYDHPAVTVREGVVYRAEVLNLTRNAVISGTPDGRSHVQMLATTAPQQLAYVGLHDMGPRQNDNEVLGRYAIHFHADYDGSRGSVLEGVSVYDSTGHAYASHLSNGVTFRDCLAHDMVDDAFWWDLSLDGQGRDLVPSNDIVYERCVAHFVKSGANSRFNLTGFMMGAGDGNIARGCIATGIEGGAESSAGYNWPSLSRDDNAWTFEGNLAHNNRHSGIYFWQNGKQRTLVAGFTAYHCGQGIFAGAYANLVKYTDCTIYACENVGLVISALPARAGRDSGETIAYTGMYVDQAGLSDYAVEITKHLSRGGRVTEISGSTFKGGRLAQVGLPSAGDHPQLYDFEDCTFDGNAFWLADDVALQTELRVMEPGGTFVVRRADQSGEPRPEWNAVVTPD